MSNPDIHKSISLSRDPDLSTVDLSLSSDASLPAARANIWNSPGTADAYAQFSRAEWYSRVVETMASLLPDISAGSVVVDLGSGTGRGAAELARRYGDQIRVIGIDPAVSQVVFARELCSSLSHVEFREGQLRSLGEVVPEAPQGIVAFNAIHLLGKFRDVLSQCASYIPEGGFLAFCTGYSTRRYEGNVGIEARRCLEKIVANAFREFPGHLPGSSLIDVMKSQGETGIETIRSNRLEKDLGDSGFAVERIEYQSCNLPLESIVDFLVLPGVGDSVLPESIPEADRRALITETLQGEGVTLLPRTWCHVVARRVSSLD